MDSDSGSVEHQCRLRLGIPLVLIKRLLSARSGHRLLIYRDPSIAEGCAWESIRLSLVRFTYGANCYLFWPLRRWLHSLDMHRDFLRPCPLHHRVHHTLHIDVQQLGLRERGKAGAMLPHELK